MNLRQHKIREVINEVSGEQFRYGAHDCCQFARKVVRALTGKEVDAPVYANEDDATLIVRNFGGLRNMLTAMLGCEPRADFGQLNDGDIVLCEFAGEEYVGVWCNQRPLIVALHGITEFPAKTVRHYWSVR